MKTIKYRKYEYTGEYEVKELEVSDNSTLYEIDFLTISKHVKDKNEYTKSYLLVSTEEFNRASCVGDFYIDILNTIYIEDTDISIMDIEEAPKIKDAYYVIEREDDKKIISKLKRFTFTSIEVYSVDSTSITCSDLKYGFIFFSKLTNNSKIAEEYYIQAEKVYKSAINE